MRGFGSSHKPEATPQRKPGDARRGGPLSPLHLPHLHLPHLPHLHLPRIALHGEHRVGEHRVLDALTHSLDLAGRGYCCAANPLEMEAAATRETKTGESKARERHADAGASAVVEGAEDAKLPGK